MKSLLLAGAATAVALFAINPQAVSHGGTYRGPGDTVPPGAGAGGGGGLGPFSPGPAGGHGPSGTPGAGPSSTPGGRPGGAPGARGRAAVTGGLNLEVDLGAWEFWWGFNQDPFLRLKSRIHARGPSTGSDGHFLGRGQKDQAHDILVPTATDRQLVTEALLASLEREGDSSNDILTGALVALAKIGDIEPASGRPGLAPVFERYLTHAHPEVAETAALCLGILANDTGVDTLIELMTDSPAGQRSISKTEVPYRMRAFACYGLGLIGSRVNDVELRQRIVRELVGLLEQRHFSTRDIKIAAMSALGRVPLDPSALAIESIDLSDPLQVSASREAQIAYLLDWLNPARVRPTGDVHHWHVRAHVPTALARLVESGVDASTKDRVTTTLIGLLGEFAKVRDVTRMSAALALGSLTDADGDGLDATAREALILASRKADGQTRRFALIALAQSGAREGQGEDAWAGSDQAQAAITRPLGKGGRLRPWAALALGVHAHGLNEAEGPGQADLRTALLYQAEKERSPHDAGAFLVALGLTRNPDAYDLLMQRLDYFKGSESARGYAALGLGLLGESKAVPSLQDLRASARYKPELMRQCSIALGLLGDKQVVEELTEELAHNARSLATQSAIATALGTIGDRRAIDPLMDMLVNQRHTKLSRAFAAVALGLVCDKDPLPWSVAYSVDINYHASSSSLTGSGNGLLDIL